MIAGYVAGLAIVVTAAIASQFWVAWDSFRRGDASGFAKGYDAGWDAAVEDIRRQALAQGIVMIVHETADEEARPN